MPAVFLFEGDEDLHVFPTVQEARSWLEPGDIRDNLFSAAYLHDGTVLQLAVRDNHVELEPTGERDTLDLTERLHLFQQLWPRVPQVADPLAYVNEYLRREWESRWPQHPRWLDRLLHRRGPRVVPDGE